MQCALSILTTLGAFAYNMDSIEKYYKTATAIYVGVDSGYDVTEEDIK